MDGLNFFPFYPNKKPAKFEDDGMSANGPAKWMKFANTEYMEK